MAGGPWGDDEKAGLVACESLEYDAMRKPSVIHIYVFSALDYTLLR